MAITYEPIATTTLGSTTTDISFSSISGSYTDLILIISMFRVTTSGHGLNIRVGNGSVDTGSNYSFTSLYGNGTAAGSNRSSNNTSGYIEPYDNSISSTNPVTLIVNLMNYSNTSTYKTLLTRGSSAADYANATVTLWRSTAAINTITISSFSTSQFAAGTTITLYGVKSA
jgi:hypothetical protein